MQACLDLENKDEIIYAKITYRHDRGAEKNVKNKTSVDNLVQFGVVLFSVVLGYVFYERRFDAEIEQPHVARYDGKYGPDTVLLYADPVDYIRRQHHGQGDGPEPANAVEKRILDDFVSDSFYFHDLLTDLFSNYAV
jgi:hypothetical protein